MFCRCPVGFGAGENTQTCPVCLGFPGALPVMNRRAIEWTIKLGLALDCEIAEQAVFARKNYFYPGSPEGLSDLTVRSAILHKRQGATTDCGRRPCDRDRARSPRGGRGEDRARRRSLGSDRRRRLLARRLQPRRHAARRDRDGAGHPLGGRGAAVPAAPAADDRRARDLGRGDGEGRRCASTPTSPCGPAGSDELRTRTEIKNMNSFNFIARGIDAEVERQIGVWESGGEVRAADLRLRRRDGDAHARGARRRRRTTTATSPSPTSCRSSRRPSSSSALRAEVPESPAARIRRIEPALDLERATVLVTGGLDRLWDETVAAGADGVAAANVIANTLVGAGVDPAAVPAAELAKLVEARDRIPRAAFDEAICEARRSRLLGRPVPRAGGRVGHRRARADRRPHPRGEPRPGRGVPRRQGGPPRLLRRPGHEGDAGQGEPARRQRARPREARRASALGISSSRPT